MLLMLQCAKLLVFGTECYWVRIAGTRTGDVSVVCAFRSVRLVFAVMTGTLVFAGIPDG